MTVSIRVGMPSDAQTIYQFIKELAEYEREPHAVEATPASLKAQLDLDPSPFECLIAENDGGPVGFALYFLNYSTWKGRSGLFVEDIYVTLDFRGRGIGRQFFSEIGRIARERECGRVEWNVLKWNESAINFYRGLGATGLDEWITYRLTGEALEKL
jgi:GNAT superfamily N-acetyltransferase